MMFTMIAVFTLVMIVDLLLLFPLEKWGDSIFPPYMAELFLCSKFQHIFQNIFQNRKNKSKLISRFFNSSHVGSEATPGRSRNEPFSPFFLDCSVISKISAHLRLSWFFSIYLIAKSVSFLQHRDESSKIFLTHNG